MSAPTTPRSVESDVVRLEIPARAELLILPRLVAAAVASRAGLAVDDIEDLRLAVDELCMSVMGEEDAGQIAIEIAREPGAVEITCAYSPASPAARTDGRSEAGLSELSSRILEALVDEHSYTSEGAQPRARLRKTSHGAPHAGVSSADPHPSD